MDSQEVSWNQDCPSAGSSPGAWVKHKVAHWPRCGGEEMRRGRHVCSTNPNRERNRDAGEAGRAEAGKG